MCLLNIMTVIQKQIPYAIKENYFPNCYRLKYLPDIQLNEIVIKFPSYPRGVFT